MLSTHAAGVESTTSSKESRPNHKIYRPWYHTAWYHFNCGMTWNPAHATSISDIDIAKRHIKLNFDCSGHWCLDVDCHDRVLVDMALGVAMKMAVGGMTRKLFKTCTVDNLETKKYKGKRNGLR